MDLMDVIYTRRSVRDYDAKPVEKQVVEKLIDAAVQAPSAMNSQPWVFAVIQDAGTLLDISNRAKSYMLSMLDKYPMLARYKDAFENPDFNIFYNASTLIIICAKRRLSPDPDTDCSMAAENIMLAAKNAGLGTCWIGFARSYLNTPGAKQLFGIPSKYVIIAPLIVGYPAGEPPVIEKNPPEVIFWK